MKQTNRLRDEDLAQRYRDDAPWLVASRYRRLEDADPKPSGELLLRWVEFAESTLRLVFWTRACQWISHAPEDCDNWLRELKDKPSLGSLVRWIRKLDESLERAKRAKFIGARAPWGGAADVLTDIRNLGLHGNLDAAIGRLDEVIDAADAIAFAFQDIVRLKLGWFQPVAFTSGLPVAWVASQGAESRSPAAPVDVDDDVPKQSPLLVDETGRALWLAPFLHVDDLGRLLMMVSVTREQRRADRLTIQYRLNDARTVYVDHENRRGFRASAEDTFDPSRLQRPARAAWAGKPLAGLPKRFEFLREIGSGGEGRVFAAHDHLLARGCAIKVVRPPSNDRERWGERVLRGARKLAAVRHNSVVQLYDLVELADGTIHLIQEFVEGKSLAELTQENQGRLDWRTAATLAGGVAGALAVVHAQNILHRDIKPDNVVLDELQCPKLIDFGLASALDNVEQTRGVGSMVWASPSAMRGQASKRTDLHSLGKVLTYMMTGVVPDSLGLVPDAVWRDPRWADCRPLRDLACELVMEHEEDAGSVAKKLVAISTSKEQTAIPQRTRIALAKRLKMTPIDEVRDLAWTSAGGHDVLLVATKKAPIALHVTSEAVTQVWQFAAANGEVETVAASSFDDMWAWSIGGDVALSKAWTQVDGQQNLSIRPSGALKVHRLRFHPSRRWLAAGVNHHQVQVWRWSDRGLEEKPATASCRNNVRVVEWFPDGERLLAGDDEGWQHVFKVEERDGQIVLESIWSTQHSDGWFDTSYQYHAAILPDGTFWAMGGNDNALTVAMGSPEYKVVDQRPRAGQLRGVAFLAATQTIVATDSSGRLSWNSFGQDEVEQEITLAAAIDGTGMALQAAPDGERLFVVLPGQVILCQVIPA